MGGTVWTVGPNSSSQSLCIPNSLLKCPTPTTALTEALPQCSTKASDSGGLGLCQGLWVVSGQGRIEVEALG